MEIADDFPVTAPASKVWGLLWDFPRLAACLPGCEEITPVDEKTYKANMKQSVGPFTIQVEMTFNVTETVQGERVAFSGSGTDRLGNRLRIDRAWVALSATSREETQVSYSAEVIMTGKLATLGYPVVKRKTRDMGVEFSRRLVAELEALR